jgi:hypothetical protein
MTIIGYAHNLKLHNSKPSVEGCIFYNKPPNNIKQIGNNNQFTKELNDLLIKGRKHNRSVMVAVQGPDVAHPSYILRDAIIQQKIISMNNSVILATDKQMCRISCTSDRFTR